MRSRRMTCELRPKPRKEGSNDDAEIDPSSSRFVVGELFSLCGPTHGQINRVTLLFARLTQDQIRTCHRVGMVERHAIEDALDHRARERVFVRQSA